MLIPNNIKLPYFAYGLFKPTELPFKQIQNFVKDFQEDLFIEGSLYIRDGLPLLKIGDGRPIKGCLINLRNEYSRDAYKKISDFQPSEHYEWTEYRFPHSNICANVLTGRFPERATILIEEELEWYSNQDPVFKEAMSVIKDIADHIAKDEFVSAPPDSFDWKRLFKLQMTYLLLWTALERYCSLTFGPTLKPNKKINRLGNDKIFKEGIKLIKPEKRIIYDSRNPKISYELNPNNALDSVRYYYQVRSNLSHRGKGAWKDGEIIRQSLIELSEIFLFMLKKQ